MDRNMFCRGESFVFSMVEVYLLAWLGNTVHVVHPVDSDLAPA